jgi:hypothetical protein
MKLPMAQERVNAQVTLPGAAPNTPPELAKWLQAELRRDREPNSVRIEPARKLAWTHRDGKRRHAAGSTGSSPSAVPMRSCRPTTGAATAR